MSRYGHNNIYDWQTLFLEFKTRTIYVYAHEDLAPKYSIGLQEILSPGYAPRKKIIFSCPAHYEQDFQHYFM
jgi:hypothetical protein